MGSVKYHSSRKMEKEESCIQFFINSPNSEWLNITPRWCCHLLLLYNGLNGGPQKGMSMSSPLEPVNGGRVFADVIKDLEIFLDYQGET